MGEDYLSVGKQIHAGTAIFPLAAASLDRIFEMSGNIYASTFAMGYLVSLLASPICKSCSVLGPYASSSVSWIALAHLLPPCQTRCRLPRTGCMYSVAEGYPCSF